MERSNPWGDLDKCGLWGDMVDVVTCAIFGDCRLRGVGVVREVRPRGVSWPSPIDLTHRPYNTGHTTVWPCDAVQRRLLISWKLLYSLTVLTTCTFDLYCSVRCVIVLVKQYDGDDVRHLNHITYTVPETGNQNGGMCQNQPLLLYDFVQCGVSLFH